MILLFFGAGASFGSDTTGTPPLGDDLFAALQQFNPQGWGRLSPTAASAFAGDFEAGVVDLSQTNPHALPPLQRAMAAYFYGFTPSPDNVFIGLANRISSVHRNVAICTINYERLLEISLVRAGMQPVVGRDAKAGTREVEICLPHGCCHLFCDSVMGNAQAVSFAGMNVQTNGPVMAARSEAEFRRRIQNDAFPPVMSYFEPAKRTTSGDNFIQAQRRRWAELVQSADVVAIVGVRVRTQDVHIWNPLASTHARLVYCSGLSGAPEFRQWMTAQRPGQTDTVIEKFFADGFDELCSSVGI
ncbi:MAG: hypothetical protein JW990_20475 [Thermoleophilia bacterium]|nr:hypothetical protein [Thermoleophilia bacterium]